MVHGREVTLAQAPNVVVVKRKQIHRESLGLGSIALTFHLGNETLVLGTFPFHPTLYVTIHEIQAILVSFQIG
jgi:hypothetical protein